MKFHFSGICGAGMGNVACLLQALGHEVKGSDANVFPPMSDQLRSAGIEILDGYGAEQLVAGFEPDVQVISNVLSKDHVEVLEGERLGLRRMSFPEVLEHMVLPKRKSFVVAGTHGKTTTSSILAQLLKSEKAGCFIGGVMKSGESGCRVGEDNAPFVLEGDEYDTAFFDKHSKFLHYGPQVLIITHLEWDHVDIFPTFEHMLDEFRTLLTKLPEDGLLVICGDHPVLKDLATLHRGPCLSYGCGVDNDVVLEAAEFVNERWQLSVRSPWGREQIQTKLMGRIYHLNLLGAWVAAKRGAELSSPELQDNLGDFTGAQRRMEILLERPAVVISDFAHHPTAIQETIAMVKEAWPSKTLVAVFDPRNATSRRNVFEDRLVEALSAADRIHLGPPPVDRRLSEEGRLNVVHVAQRIGAKACGYEDPETFLSSVLEEQKEGVVILVMSCGSCHGLLQQFKGLEPLEA